MGTSHLSRYVYVYICICMYMLIRCPEKSLDRNLFPTTTKKRAHPEDFGTPAKRKTLLWL
ncbi:hypothetical protein GGTG_11679 [Gaeumannomyces tritici R3-111a-1]|uniref:Uncharacterized protein n=1 Tax=Gaeumannomyces tritici (strain R3-111a-1) TaxID=644352 RepID=J3PDV6_GAET3|nr:hypothetical protein GGTG_11679 [Gaeumannomyces tritici R3-111a-1]EJT70656.1 hypothetical protein GGTG_11679 [Gaeumannomyces tritici R3-111a-1]